MVKPDELITGRQMGPRGIVGAEEHGDNVDISHTHAYTHTGQKLTWFSFETFKLGFAF